MSSSHSVLVDNRVKVQDGTWKEAKTAFLKYRKTKASRVTWLKDGKVYVDYIGVLK